MSDLIDRDRLKDEIECAFYNSIIKMSVSELKGEIALANSKGFATCLRVIKQMPPVETETANRVLTPDEILDQDFVWLEETTLMNRTLVSPVLVYDKSCDNANSRKPCIIFVRRYGVMEDYLPDKYNKNWRCWLRKPTPEETQKVPWKEESSNDKG